jgi:hypothetical protein
MIARFLDGSWRTVKTATESGPPVPGLTNLDYPIGWTLDRRAIVAGAPREVPMRLQRVDLVTGQRTPIKTLIPPESAGVNFLAAGYWNERNKSYVYSYGTELTQLFTVTGVIR